MSTTTPVEKLTAWAESRGQRVFISQSAATAFVAMRDPRLPEWEFDDVRLALECGRWTLPWLPELERPLELGE